MTMVRKGIARNRFQENHCSSSCNSSYRLLILCIKNKTRENVMWFVLKV